MDCSEDEAEPQEFTSQRRVRDRIGAFILFSSKRSLPPVLTLVYCRKYSSHPDNPREARQDTRDSRACPASSRPSGMISAFVRLLSSLSSVFCFVLACSPPVRVRVWGTTKSFDAIFWMSLYLPCNISNNPELRLCHFEDTR